MFSLKGKKALITGASGGIGAAIAEIFCKAGATILLSGTNEDKLNKVKEKLASNKVYQLKTDLSDPEKTKQLVEKTIETLGGIDILVCNAGITKDTLAIRMKDEDFDKVINVNLKSTFILNREALKYMIRNKAGRIINISSVVAFTGNPGQVNYCASKAGMIAMSKALAKETASRGITVNCIAPGFIKTQMTEVLTDEQKEKITSLVPVKHIGSPSDIAYSALYLASNESSYITGTTLHVNGGMFTN
ncbi:MAG: 3-oxoacyl-ACP reductase FabG [Rickettsiales bacterium]|nr:3-oxoacyl-ACP reductase FabG [Rickettsiales bacterium]